MYVLQLISVKISMLLNSTVFRINLRSGGPFQNGCLTKLMVASSTTYSDQTKNVFYTATHVWFFDCSSNCNNTVKLIHTFKSNKKQRTQAKRGSTQTFNQIKVYTCVYIYTVYTAHLIQYFL